MLEIILLLNLLFWAAGVIYGSPIHSVLCLVLAFLNAGLLLILQNVEFLGIVIVIVYVGAVAVLFLFIIMMLNMKKFGVLELLGSYFTQNGLTLNFFLSGSLLGFLISQSFIFFSTLYNNNSNLSLIEPILIDSTDNIVLYGLILWNDYQAFVLLAGLILLVALIGAIVLTVNFKNKVSFLSKFKSNI